MKRVYVEVTCDWCGSADHYTRPDVDAKAESSGWIIRGRKHFCSDACERLGRSDSASAINDISKSKSE